MNVAANRYIAPCVACGEWHCSWCVEVHLDPSNKATQCDDCSFELFGDLMTPSELRRLRLRWPKNRTELADNLETGRFHPDPGSMS